MKKVCDICQHVINGNTAYIYGDGTVENPETHHVCPQCAELMKRFMADWLESQQYKYSFEAPTDLKYMVIYRVESEAKNAKGTPEGDRKE